MSTTNRIDSSQSPVDVQAARARQTERPATPFRDVLAGGAGILLAGAEVAASVTGGPILAAAVRASAAGFASAAIAPAGPPTVSSDRGVVSGPAGAIAASAGRMGEAGDMAQMHEIQRESQAFNLQLLGLQEEVQQENRRFTTLTNVMRAKHDTAKAALGNIRS